MLIYQRFFDHANPSNHQVDLSYITVSVLPVSKLIHQEDFDHANHFIL